MAQGIESRLALVNGGITFTVNTAVSDVSWNLVANSNLSVNGAIMNLPYADNCEILGFCLSYPYQFGQGQIDQGASNPMFVQLGWCDQTGNNGSVDEVGDTGLINIPDPNVWYDCNVHVPCPDTADSKWRFRLIGGLGEVSMINAPAGLNAEELDICFHLRIRSTLALVA